MSDDDENAPMHPYSYSYESYYKMFITAGYSHDKATWLAQGEYDDVRYQAAVKAWDDWMARRLLTSEENGTLPGGAA